MIVELPPLEQRDLVDLGLEVDGEPAEAGDAVGEVDGQHHRLHALNRQRLPHHRLELSFRYYFRYTTT